MTNLTGAQAAYLRQIAAQTARYERALEKTTELREALDEMLRAGRLSGH